MHGRLIGPERAMDSTELYAVCRRFEVVRRMRDESLLLCGVDEGSSKAISGWEDG